MSQKRSYLERLHMVSDGRRGASHPVLYSHPETGKRTMCFHLGMTEGFVIDKGKLISTSIPVSLNLHHIKFLGYVTLSVPSPSMVTFTAPDPC